MAATMLNIVSLLAAATVLSLLAQFYAEGAILANKMDLDNSLKPNVASTPKHVLKNNVHIYVAPPKSVQIPSGGRALISCEAIGVPGPTIAWLKNGEPLIDYEEESNEILPMYPSTIGRMTSRLVLTDAVNGDVYTCLATAGLKQKSSSTTVYVIDSGDSNVLLEKLLESPRPVITAFYNSIIQMQGTNVILPCRTYGDAQVYWQDSDGNILYSNDRVRVLPSGDLLIQGLQWSDMGEYFCVATNNYGKDVATTFLYPIKKSSTW